MNYLLFNKLSKNGNNMELRNKVKALFKGEEVVEDDVIDLDYDKYFEKLTENDNVTLVGGDGTLNHFVNIVNGKNLPCKFYFYAGGTGNDFFNDMKDYIENDRVLLNEVIKDLPIAIIKGKEYRFINGIGYGIDGYCCEMGDKLQAKSTKPVNYTSIAIKGLLFKYKAPNGRVTVDGVTKEYKHIWLAPTMKGKFYGGGMMIAPNQDRFNKDQVTSVVMYGSGKLKTLLRFSSIFKGEHIKYTDMVEVRCGKNIKVEFDKPQALQVDGETISNVLSYEVRLK